MSDSPQKLPPESQDELAQKLRDSLERKRPRRASMVIVAALLAVALAAALWFFYPREDPVRLQAVAYDAIGLSRKPVTLHGGLDAHEPNALLAQREIQFLDATALAKPVQELKPVLVRTGAKGHASCVFSFDGDPFQAEFVVRIVGDKRRPGTEDRGRVFFPSADTPICFVQIEETLTSATEQTWKKTNLIDIPPRPDAGGALDRLRKKGVQVVYLAMQADRPLLYQKMRGWVRRQAKEGPTPFPPGPVLGRFSLAAAEESRPWQHMVRSLIAMFPEPREPGHLAIAGALEVAQQLHAAGCTTYYLGEGEQVPPPVRRVADWKTLSKELP